MSGEEKGSADKRTELAQERTDLAHERTKLARQRTKQAYIRTSLSLILAGLAFLGFHIHQWWFLFVGTVSLACGIAMLCYSLFVKR